jgi:hypothetical protein
MNKWGYLQYKEGLLFQERLKRYEHLYELKLELVSSQSMW